MGLKKLRIEYWGGVKIVVLRTEALPNTYDEFFYLLASKMPPIASAAEQYVVRLKYKDQDGSVAVHLDDDDDLLVMYDSGETNVVSVELEEVTDATRDRLWTKERFEEARELVAISSQKSGSIRRSPSSHSGIVAAAPVQDQWNSNGRPSITQSRSNSIDLRGSSDYYASSSPPIAAAALPPNLQRDGSMNRDQGSMGREGSMGRSHPPPYMTYSTPSIKDVGLVGSLPASKHILLDGKAYAAYPVDTFHQSAKVEVLTVIAAAREYKFPLVWKSADTTTTEEIMGPLGKHEWSVQRSWGYKKVKHDEPTMTITYAPRKFSLRGKLGGDTHYHFTIMYDSHQLFTAAVSRYHPKFDSMSAAQFRMLLMDPISTSVTTEWACVQPPSAFVPENPKIGGDYHVLYVVKDISRDMTESTKTRMQSWLKGQMIAGSWATQMLQRGHSGAPDGAEPVSQAELRLLGM